MVQKYIIYTNTDDKDDLYKDNLYKYRAKTFHIFFISFITKKLGILLYYIRMINRRGFWIHRVFILLLRIHLVAEFICY